MPNLQACRVRASGLTPLACKSPTLQNREHRWQPISKVQPQVEGGAAKDVRRLPHLSSDLSQDSVSSTLLARRGLGMAGALLPRESFTANEASAEEGSRQCTALESTR